MSRRSLQALALALLSSVAGAQEMAQMMQMNDAASTGRVLIDELEWRDTSAGSAAAWQAAAWYGNDRDKLWARTEGEGIAGTDGRIELLWDRVVTRWWDLQAGARQDFGNGPPRTWGALGLQGLAPGWVDVEAAAYAGEAGRTAARLRLAGDLLLSQRLIVQPEAEANLYGKADPARELGSGLSDLEIGVRLRYEIRREFAPYAGIVWQRLFGGTKDDARVAGRDVSGVQLAAGVRVWF